LAIQLLFPCTSKWLSLVLCILMFWITARNLICKCLHD
jgi:hypothetical protein